MMSGILDFAIPGAFIAFVIFVAVKAYRQTSRARENNEAMFASMFPDLQPYFHPKKVAEYVFGRRTRLKPNVRFSWKNPPGFGVAEADIDPAGERENVRLLDAGGQEVAQFAYEDHPEGGVLRVGKGKFTADTRVKEQPRVRYWHPDREFKWTPNSWKFVTRMAEQPMDSSDRGTSFSSDSPSSSSSVATGAAAAAGIAAAGGAFDGGGASHAFADGGRGGDGGSDSASASSTSY
jgi:hypothetical protein